MDSVTAGVDIVALTRALVDIDSTTGNEGAACRWLADYLRAAGFDVLVSLGEIFDLKSKTPRLEREIARRFSTRVEVLVKPIRGRLEETSRPPVYAYALFAFLPKIRIALTGQD